LPPLILEHAHDDFCGCYCRSDDAQVILRLLLRLAERLMHLALTMMAFTRQWLDARWLSAARTPTICCSLIDWSLTTVGSSFIFPGIFPFVG